MRHRSRAEADLEAIARSRLPDLLAEVLGTRRGRVRVEPAAPGAPYDLRVTIEQHRLLVEVSGQTAPAALTRKWERVEAAASKAGGVPAILVPYMTGPARALCAKREINWLDLSGNASVRAPGLYLRVGGNPNRHARRGRPSSVFERRSSRLVRLLLQTPGREWSVRECATLTTLDEGHVSRIVQRLIEDELLSRGERRRFQVRNPGGLLDAWRAAADFSKHRSLRGHVPARSGEELLHLLSARLREIHLEHAATGLGAAWLYDHFAMFRLATFYVRDWPSLPQLDHLHFREDPSGANVWLVLPNDDGVFAGSRLVDEIPCVHPVQVYVDLTGHPERAAEAAEHMRSNVRLLGVASGS